MKVYKLMILLLLVFSAPAFAGRIFGNLKEGGSSVGQGVEVQIKCESDNSYSTKTDEYGAYEIYVQAGRCDLKVGYKGQWTPTFPVVSSDDPARYDFDLVIENGQYVLKRR